MTNLATLLFNSVNNNPERIAMRSETELIDYGEFGRLAALMHQKLRDVGVGVGDRVALVSPNRVTMPVAYYGILSAGAVVVPLNPLLTGRELEALFGDAEISAVVVAEDLTEHVREVVESMGTGTPVISLGATSSTMLTEEIASSAQMVERADDDVAVLLYTSGTTGKPKGAMLTHHNLSSNAWMTTRMFNYTSDDVLMGSLPFFHVFGQTMVLNAAIAVSGCVSVISAFQPRAVLRQIKEHGITRFVGVPSMYVAVNSLQRVEKENYPSLKSAVSGGASIPVEVLKEFESLFGVTIYEGYGLSETSPAVCFNQPVNGRVPGSIGTACEGADIRIIDDAGQELPRGEIGEIAVKGQYVMAGYWKQPEATENSFINGFFRTGDVGRQDHDGRFFIVDRKKDMILHNGYNVYPREVEELLYQNPAVHEAAVVGKGEITVGQDVVACVVLNEGADSEAVVAQLRQAARDGLAMYKRPRYYKVLDALPKGPTGKILKRAIVLD